jgi:peptide/nickel transport system substrate-binding protein
MNAPLVPSLTTTDRLSTGGAAELGRRSLFGLGLAAGSAAFLAACGGTSTASVGAGAAAGGTLKFGWALVTSWDPVTSSAGWDVHALSLVYTGLTKLDEKANAVPALASAWKYNADGTQVTFTLRPGLTFSDGTVLDATAVKKSLERGRDYEKSLVAAQLTNFKAITAPDATTVVIDLKVTDYQVPNLLAGKTGHVVSPAAFTANAAGLALKPVGHGPFTLDSYVPQASAKLTKFAKYWDAGNILLDKFELYPAPEAATAVAALQSGRLDVAQIPGSQVDAAKAAGLEVQIDPSLVVSVLDVNITKAPFTDPKVALALKYAVDRKAIVATQTFGHATVNYQPFPEGYVGHAAGLDDAYAYDPAKAKALLAEAGHPDGVDVTLTTTAPQGQAEQLQAQLAQSGFRVKLETIPAAQATQIMYIQHDRPLAEDQFAGRESPVQAFQVLFGQQGLMNPGRQTPPELTAAIAKVVGTALDSPDYPVALQAATKLAVETQPNVFINSVPRILARRKNVTPVGAYLMAQRFEGVKVS